MATSLEARLSASLSSEEGVLGRAQPAGSDLTLLRRLATLIAKSECELFLLSDNVGVEDSKQGALASKLRSLLDEFENQDITVPEVSKTLSCSPLGSIKLD